MHVLGTFVRLIAATPLFRHEGHDISDVRYVRVPLSVLPVLPLNTKVDFALVPSVVLTADLDINRPGRVQCSS